MRPYLSFRSCLQYEPLIGQTLRHDQNAPKKKERTLLGYSIRLYDTSHGMIRQCQRLSTCDHTHAVQSSMRLAQHTRRERTSLAVKESRPEVGSSRKSTRGLVTSASPMLVRFACPPAGTDMSEAPGGVNA